MNVGCQRTKRKLAVRYPLQTSQSAVVSAFAKCFRRGCFFLNYKQAVDYIKNIERAGSDYGIERMRELLSLLSDPDDKLKFIHVAGTNGKGSVTAYLTSVLKEAGYKVGTYNSPSVFCYNERWLIDGKPLEDKDVAHYLTIVRETIENEQNLRAAFGLDKFQPTAFEIETAVAFLAFYEKECDVCVLETGLGGRWDATNVIRQKELAIITPIGLDHCQILGNTLGQIASEKAAIIRDVAVTCKQSDEIMQEILHPYRTEDGKRIDVTPTVEIAKEPRLVSSDLSGQKFVYDGKEYFISMLGKHQLVNASIVLCAVDALRRKHWDIPQSAVEKGLAKAVWHARLEVVKNAKEKFNISVPQDKVLVFDGSHNPQGAMTLKDAIETYFVGKRIHLVLGILKDKDVKGICKILAPLAHKITCITPPSPRAMDKDELKEIVSCYPCQTDECDDIKLAVQSALDDKDSDVVILCGSLTLFCALTNK